MKCICFRILLKSQFKKHLILGGLIGGQLYGPNELVQLGEIDNLETGKYTTTIMKEVATGQPNTGVLNNSKFVISNASIFMSRHCWSKFA